jgi:Integrase core domain
MNAYLTKLMMYHEVHRMSREGCSVSKICRTVLLNWRTVKSYLSMDEGQYEQFLAKQSDRNKELLLYEGFVKSRLEQYQDTSAAQMHDWLKEHCEGFPPVSARTVFNFVAWVRQQHHLPKICLVREYEMVEETPYGKQAQVDFGEYTLRDNHGKRVKVFFFTMVLSRSRYKYIWFTTHYFTSELSVQAHERAFAFFEGIPEEVVYDQDKVFIVSENKGDIILTEGFRAYTRERPFRLHFCRKSDPESKGKIENVVKYTKQNFLYNRPFSDIDTLNQEALAWLLRTANQLPHNGTKKEPYAQWNIEKSFLQPYTACPTKPALVFYTIRKDNTISWKSNFYSLPLGSYKGRGSEVAVQVENNELVLCHADGTEICRHLIAIGSGQKVKKIDHTRDKTSAIAEMMEQLCAFLDNPGRGMEFFRLIRQSKPRYIRDQLLLFRSVAEKADRLIITEALEYCCQNKVNSAGDFQAVVEQYTQSRQTEQAMGRVLQMNPLSGSLPAEALMQPATSAIADYEIILQIKYQS